MQWGYGDMGNLIFRVQPPPQQTRSCWGTSLVWGHGDMVQKNGFTHA